MLLPLLTALALIPGVAEAATVPKTEYSLRLAPYNIGTQDYRFPSGLRILFQEDHTQPIVSVTNWFDRGSIYDGTGVSGKSVEGIAHAVEHLAFRAKHGDLPKNWDVINQLGGILNASTSTDWTNYMTVAPVDAAVPLLRIEALRMDNGVAGVTADDVEAEKSIVRNELRMGYEMGSNGSAEIRTALLHVPKLLYPADHPYRNSTIGSHETISNIQLPDVQRFVRENYRPEFSTIALVGDIDLSGGQGMRFVFEAFDGIEHLLMAPADAEAYKKLTDQNARIKFLNDWVPQKLEPFLKGTQEAMAKPRVTCDARPEPPPRQSAEIPVIQGMVDKPTAIIAWSLPGGYCPDDVNANIAANVLTGYIGRILDPDYNPLNQESEIDGLGCFAMQDRVNSVVMCMIVQGALSKDKPQRLIEKASDALYLQWQPIDAVFKPFYDANVAYSKLSAMSDVLGMTDNVASLYGRSFFVAQHAHYRGSPMFFSDTMNEYNAMDIEQARELAKKYITRDRMVGLVIEPMDEETREQLEASSSEADKSNTVADHRAKDDHGRQLFDSDSLTPEAIARVTVVPDLSKAKTFNLENGLEVVIMNHGEAPIAKVGLIVNGDDSVSPYYGVNKLAEELYNTATLSNQNPLEDPLRVAGGVYRSNNEVYATGSSGNVDALLHKVRWNVEDYSWMMAEKPQALKSWTAGVKKDGKKPETWADRIRTERLFADHAYGRWLKTSDYDALGELKPSQIQDWVYRKWQPANAKLVVVGKIDLDETEKLVREYFAEWAPRSGVEVGEIKPPPAATKLPERQVLLFDKPIGTQTKLQLTCPLKYTGTQDTPRTQVIGEILTFFAFEKLREEKGLTYGAYAYPRRRWGNTTELIIASVIQNNGAGFGVETMLQLVDDGASGKFDEGVVRTNKWNVARTSVTGIQSGDQMLEALLSPARGNLDYYKSYPKNLSEVSKDSIADALSTCKGHEIVTLVGPVDKIKPQLDERKIKYEVVDWEAMHLATLTPKEQKSYQEAKAKEAEEKAKKAAEKAG